MKITLGNVMAGIGIAVLILFLFAFIGANVYGLWEHAS